MQAVRKSLSRLSPRGSKSGKSTGNSPPPRVVSNSSTGNSDEESNGATVSTSPGVGTPSTGAFVVQRFSEPAPPDSPVDSGAVRLPASAITIEPDFEMPPPEKMEEATAAATQVQALVRGRSERKVVTERKAAAAKEAARQLEVQAAEEAAARLAAEEAEAARLRAEAAALAEQQRMEAERKQREYEEELERRRVEQLQMEEQRRKAEAAHRERMAAIATKKARDRAAEDEREAKHALLLEDELEAKLAVDLVDLASREQAAQQALAATEAAEAAVASGLATMRLQLAEIASLEEKARSLDQVKDLFTAYHTQCAGCYGALEAAEDAAKVERANQDFIKARVERELKESEDKLAKQSAATAAKQTELDMLADNCTAAEERAVEALLLATSEATAQAMKLQMASQATQLRAEEHVREEETLAETNLVLAGQQSRAEATQASVDETKAKLDADRARIGVLTDQIQALELAEEHATLQAKLVHAGFETDMKATTELKVVQERVLARPTPPPLGTPGVAPEETILNEAFQLAAEAEGGQPTRETLLEEMQSLVRARYGATATCLEDVQLRKAQFEADVEAARAQRKDQLIATNAEKTALEMGVAEREAYLTKKEAQLKVERAEVSATAKKIHGIEQCIRMLAEEVATSKAYQSKCQGASEAASASQAAAAEALEALRQTHKEKLRQTRATLASEAQVREQNWKYAQGLRAQLEAMQVQIASHPLAAEFEWKGEGTAPNQAGPQLLSQNGFENTRWLAELQARRGETGTQLDELRRRLAAAEKQAAHESKRLAEQRAQQVTVLYDLEKYEEQLEAKSPRAAAATSPRRSPRRQRPGFSPPTADQPVASSAPPASDGGPRELSYPDAGAAVSGPLSAEAISAQQQFLKSREAAIAQEGGDDDRDPLYNPDVPRAAQ